jgi:hypothetical protein
MNTKTTSRTTQAILPAVDRRSQRRTIAQKLLLDARGRDGKDRGSFGARGKPLLEAAPPEAARLIVPVDHVSGRQNRDP